MAKADEESVMSDKDRPHKMVFSKSELILLSAALKGSIKQWAGSYINVRTFLCLEDDVKLLGRIIEALEEES
jgi:hypothetical protein